jgi:hypothetical protein
MDRITPPNRVPALDRVARRLPGWMLLISGLAMIAAAVLTPAWTAVRDLHWQEQIMQVQADRLADQTQAYLSFHDALVHDDPVLLERLAFHYLSYKPVGVRPLTGTPPADLAGSVAHANYVERPGAAATVGTGPGVLTVAQGDRIDDWLRVALPQVGVDYPVQRPVRSRLVRITRGWSGLALIAAGALLVMVGLEPTPRLRLGRIRRELRESWWRHLKRFFLRRSPV